jgi:hypothetical protein
LYCKKISYRQALKLLNREIAAGRINALEKGGIRKRLENLINGELPSSQRH